MGVGLHGSDQSGADPDSVGAGTQCSGCDGPVGYATCPQHQHVGPLVSHRPQERVQWDASASMAAGLAALSHYPVDTEFYCGRGNFGDEACIHTRIPAERSVLTQRAGGGSWWKTTSGTSSWTDASMCSSVLAAPNAVSAQMRSTPNGPQVKARNRSTITIRLAAGSGMLQHTQSAGIGDGGRKLLVCDESHTRSDERMPEAVLPGQAGLKSRDVPISGRVGHGFSFNMLRFGVSSL